MLKYSSLVTIFVCFLCSFALFFAACFGQSTSSQIGTNPSESVIVPPRIDSVLQFNSMITAMFEDSRGHLWMGKLDGVYRYDGENFEDFK